MRGAVVTFLFVLMSYLIISRKPEEKTLSMFSALSIWKGKAGDELSVTEERVSSHRKSSTNVHSFEQSLGQLALEDFSLFPKVEFSPFAPRPPTLIKPPIAIPSI